MQISPYVTFNGDALEALEFYASSLGGSVMNVMTFGEIPDGTDIPPGFETRLAHGRVEFAGGTLMASDDFQDKDATFEGVKL